MQNLRREFVSAPPKRQKFRTKMYWLFFSRLSQFFFNNNSTLLLYLVSSFHALSVDTVKEEGSIPYCLLKFRDHSRQFNVALSSTNVTLMRAGK